MEKVDFKKTLPSLKAKAGKFDIIEVPKFQYLMVDGHGSPAHKEYADAVQTLYPVAYTLKFMSKIDLKKDYTVAPLSGLWWADDMSYFNENKDKSKWDWTSMILTPDWITQDHFKKAVEDASKKKDLPSGDKIRLEDYDEGLCVQTLHLGPYDQEGPTIKQMHETVLNDGYSLTGKHHEIYFSDPRRVDPSKLKTIIRQPIEK